MNDESIFLLEQAERVVEARCRGSLTEERMYERWEALCDRVRQEWGVSPVVLDAVLAGEPCEK